jgi:hypothetical protein
LDRDIISGELRDRERLCTQRRNNKKYFTEDEGIWGVETYIQAHKYTHIQVSTESLGKYASFNLS